MKTFRRTAIWRFKRQQFQKPQSQFHKNLTSISPKLLFNACHLQKRMIRLRLHLRESCKMSSLMKKKRRINYTIKPLENSIQVRLHRKMNKKRLNKMLTRRRLWLILMWRFWLDLIPEMIMVQEISCNNIQVHSNLACIIRMTLSWPH